MNRFSFKRSIATHGCAILLGLGGAKFFVNPLYQGADAGSAGHVETNRPRNRPAAGNRLSSSPAFRKAYEELATRTMTADERIEMKQRLLYEWAECDPVGFVAFLEKKRVWPSGFSLNDNFSDWGLHHGSLSRDRPDLLLDFAIRNGSADAISLLDTAVRFEGNGNPESVMCLIDALSPNQRGPEIRSLAGQLSQKMGRNGIAITNSNEAYLLGVAEGQIYDEGRLDEFFATFKKINDESIRKSLANNLGYSLSDEIPGAKALEQILRLPLEYREEAVSGMFLGSDENTLILPEAREMRRQWIETLVEAGLGKGAKEGVDDLVKACKDGDGSAELTTWVGSFPSDDSWQPIIEEVARWWLYSDRDGMVREVLTMPEGAARDMLAARAAADMPMYGAKLEQPVIDRLVSLIVDPQIRKKFERTETPE